MAQAAWPVPRPGGRGGAVGQPLYRIPTARPTRLSRLRATTPRGARLVWHGFVLARRSNRQHGDTQATKNKAEGRPELYVCLKPRRTVRRAKPAVGRLRRRALGARRHAARRVARARWSERELANGHNMATPGAHSRSNPLSRRSGNTARFRGCAGLRGWGPDSIGSTVRILWAGFAA